MNNKQNQLKYTSSLIGLILTVTLTTAFVVNYVISYIVATWIPHIMYEPWYALSVNALGLYIVGYSIFSFGMKKIPDYVREFNTDGEASSLELNMNDECLKVYSLKDLISIAFICIAALYLSNFIAVAINAAIAYLKGTDIVNPLQIVISSSNLIYTFIFVCVVAPVFEELMFRKILLNKLLPYGKKLSVIVSAFAFGLFHGNLNQIFYAFILGLIFAHLTISSGKINYAIILHIVINTLGSVVFPAMLLHGNTTIAAVAVFLVFQCIITGVILFLKNGRAFFPKHIEIINNEQYKTMKLSTSILSPGMIVFWIAITTLVIARTFFFNF